MSASLIYRAANDPDLIQRVTSTAMQEVQANDELANTAFGRALLQGVQSMAALMWPVAVSTAAAYESAVAAGRGAPGHDTDVISDADLTAAVVAGWPPDPAPMTPPTT